MNINKEFNMTDCRNDACAHHSTRGSQTISPGLHFAQLGSKAKRIWEEVAFPLTDDRSVHVFSNCHQVFNCFSLFGFISSSLLSQELGPSPDLVSPHTAAKSTTMDVQPRQIMWQLLPANGPPTVMKVFHWFLWPQWLFPYSYDSFKTYGQWHLMTMWAGHPFLSEWHN